jgi:predicted esterase
MPLPSIELETGPNPGHAVIWLHGLGADGHDFEPIVPELVDPAWPALRFVFPHAPVRPITINGGMPMRAWYDISGLEIAQRQDETGLRASMGLLDELDPTISHALGEMSHAYLAQRGYDIEWHAYQMAHQVCMDEILDMRGWLGARLG